MYSLTKLIVTAILLVATVLGSAESNIFDEQEIRLDRTDRIVGGDEAAPGQFPYIASLRLYLISWSQWCGGSIITNRFILTAGHCRLRKKIPLARFRVWVGAHKVEGDDGKAYDLERFIVQEQFIVNGTRKNDIGLIKTNATIEFNAFVAPIQLHRGFIAGGYRAIASGYGHTNDLIRSLKFIYLTTLSNDECRKLFANEKYKPVVFDNETMCTISGKYGHGVCTGDNGGPLVHNNQLIGVTSYTAGCGVRLPEAYARISTYIGWIQRTIAAN